LSAGRADEIVLIGAHLDSWDFGPGANDDGAGTAIAFGVARLIAGLPQRTSRTIRVAPGGPSDVLARIIGKKLSELLGQPFVIENKPGAGGNIAAETVARATPDGYTLLIGNNSFLATNASLYKNIGYDAEKDFAPISLIGSQANILVVNPMLRVNTMTELIALAKAKPGQLDFASSGYGAAALLSGELFKAQAHVDIVHVAYKGAAPALQDVIAGHVQMMFATSASVVGPRLRYVSQATHEASAASGAAWLASPVVLASLAVRIRPATAVKSCVPARSQKPCARSSPEWDVMAAPIIIGISAETRLPMPLMMP
jgi:tripartite-type tricarboxylate transporter receptor subunit TctC